VSGFQNLTIKYQDKFCTFLCQGIFVEPCLMRLLEITAIDDDPIGLATRASACRPGNDKLQQMLDAKYPSTRLRTGLILVKKEKNITVESVKSFGCAQSLP